MRGAERFGTGAEYIDLQARLNAFHRTINGPELVQHKVETLQKVVADALQTAGVSISQIDHVVVPHLGWAILRREFLQPLALQAEQTTWNYGRRIGHLGPSDQITGLHHLASSGRLAPGQHVLMLASAAATPGVQPCSRSWNHRDQSAAVAATVRSGRGVETAIVGWIVEQARASGVFHVESRFVASGANSVARDFWTDAGFTPTGEPGWFALDLSEPRRLVPAWVRIREESADP